MERALKNTVIAKDYGLSLKCFFKDKFKYWDDSYAIPFAEFRRFKKYFFEYIRSSCNGDRVCGRLNTCYGHQFMQFIEAIHQLQRYAVTKKKIFYKYFFITNFELTNSSTQLTLIPTKIKKWRVVCIEEEENLDGLTYSERLTYLK